MQKLFNGGKIAFQQEQYWINLISVGKQINLEMSHILFKNDLEVDYRLKYTV